MSDTLPSSQSGESLALEVDILGEISSLPAADWNALAGNGNPFVRHEFLHALEQNGCVSEDTGWVAHHLVIRTDGALMGALPMYVKAHSYGEFVFDWAWGEAYERAGLQYYPKLVCAVPFTPATGPRILFAGDDATHTLRRTLTEAALEVARRSGVSSLHWLFPDEPTAPIASSETLLERTGCQFHWTNPGFRDFKDYLDALSSKRRKQIRRERREAQAAPVDILVLPGSAVSAQQWHAYHELYASTYDRKWGYPSLTPGFFEQIGDTMGDAVLLILAKSGTKYVAGAHLLVGEDRLYGRNWGCSEYHASLHFEMCYYAGIDYCLEHGLAGFEAGAQGEHKIYRGFMPVRTRSLHWIRHPQFRDAIADFLTRERVSIDGYIDDMVAHSPFKERGSGGG